MKATELRIGNWISIPQYGNSKNIATIVTPDIITAKHTESLHSGRFEPIPLTKEWLINFGFKEVICPDTTGEGYVDEVCYELKTKEVFFSYADDFSLGISYEKDSTMIVPTIGIIRNVHQIQNLYFALTGEELELNK